MLNNKTPRLWLTIIIIALMLSGSAGCLRVKRRQLAPRRTTVGYPLSITDSYQRRVAISRPPRRIVSLAPNITETLFALGKGRLLVGRTDYCDYPVAARRVTTVGNLLSPNIEKITQLQPDLVIASTHFPKAVLTKLAELGIKVVVLYGEASFTGAYETIRKVGRIVNADRAATQVIVRMKQKVAAVAAKVRGRPKPRVYYVVSFGRSGNYTAGRDTFIGAMLKLAGGVNVAADTVGWQYSVEKLVAHNPELVICSQYFNTKASLRQATGSRDLAAVKAGRLYEIDNNLLDRQGPRLADGLAALARIIHPEAGWEKDKE
jgi:iron complex transport system substrate-binding protein